MKSQKESDSDEAHHRRPRFEPRVTACLVRRFGLVVAPAVNPPSATIDSSFPLSGFGYMNPKPPTAR